MTQEVVALELDQYICITLAVYTQNGSSRKSQLQNQEWYKNPNQDHLIQGERKQEVLIALYHNKSITSSINRTKLV